MDGFGIIRVHFRYPIFPPNSTEITVHMWLKDSLSRVFTGVYNSAMRTRRRNVSENRRTRSKKPLYKMENSVPIPIDLIIEILSRLPAKSIARFRCVSKLWASILRRPDFTELFFTRSSSTRPQLLFTCVKGSELFFFSSPQLQNLSLLAANYLMKLPLYGSFESCGNAHGLVGVGHVRDVNGMEEMLAVIYNPTTRQSLNLPTRIGIAVTSYFGYDPIDKQFKVLLFMSRTRKEAGLPKPNDLQVQVLTITTGQLSWRMIKCNIPHYPLSNAVCIDGVLYYGAEFSSRAAMIICFDVRSEKFKFITLVGDSARACHGNLINYNGKLASLISDRAYVLHGTTRSINLWILQDAEKQKWSEHITPFVAEYSGKQIVTLRWSDSDK